MSDYTPTGKPQTLSPQVSKQMRDEFQSIADAVNSKSDVDGDTYTGVHDFTGATLEVPTQPTPDSSDQAASTAFVHQVVDVALPNQAGHAGETLITDGTTASWGHDVTKANKAGDTYTGTHNFSGAAVAVPTYSITTSSTAVASTLFVRSQPNWEVIDVNNVTSSIASNRRGEIYVCGPAVTDLNLPTPTGRFYVRAHNPNAGVVTINAGAGGGTINGSPSISLPSGGTVTITRDGSTGNNYRAFFFNVGRGSGSGTPYDTYQDFLTSGTFTVQKTGLHRITAIGAGGSGGRRAVSDADPDARYAAGGGGAGGACVKEVMLTQGESYTVVIGAGGGGRAINAAGRAGGTTTVTGPGVSMTANGGDGGASNGTTGSTSALSVLGGDGGSASGGDVNHTGGDGGQAQVLAGSGVAAAAGGGGAPSIFGTRPAGGGAIALPLVGGGANEAASGGGASAGGSGSPSTLGGAPAGSVTPTPSDNSFRDDIGYSSADWRVGYPVRGNTPTIGDGRGYGSNGTTNNTSSGNAQAFAGSGGACIVPGTAGDPNSGAAGLGGGSGGLAGRANYFGESGAGGDGFVIFEWVS